MKEYKKIKKFQRLSDLVGCLKRIHSGTVSLLLLIIHFILIILNVMNLFIIINWEILKKSSLLEIQIVILSFMGVSLIFIILNMIFRRRKNFNCGYFNCVLFFASIFCLILFIINFILGLILIIIIVKKVKKNKEGKISDYNSIIPLNIFSLIILFISFFLWYYEILVIYAKIKYDESIKDFIDKKISFCQSQNAKIVNIELGNKSEDIVVNNGDIHGKNIEEDDVISNNKIEINEEKMKDQKSISTKDKGKDEISNSSTK